MELSGHKFKVFINGDCENICKKDDLDILTEYCEPMNIRNLKTFYTIISFEPTYKSITNRFRIPDQYNHNKRYKTEATPLSDFMKVEEIKTIDYFDYVGEHIHRIINQEKTWEAGDFEVANPKDVILVTEKYKDYLIKQFSMSNLDSILSELNGLIKIAGIAERYGKELWFFDGYHWQE